MIVRDDVLLGPVAEGDLDIVEAAIRDVLGATCARLVGVEGTYLAVKFGRRAATREGLAGFVRGVLWRRGQKEVS